jgi:2-aminobenzoate-CoA ligase
MIEIIETYKERRSCSPHPHRLSRDAFRGGQRRRSVIAQARSVGGRNLACTRVQDWVKKIGTPILDGIGSTELLHIFISNQIGDSSPASTGLPVAGYEKPKVVDNSMKEKPRGEPGWLAVRGPTGYRYLSDSRQKTYVRDG